MENKVISTEYVKKNFIHKDKIRDMVIRIKNSKVKSGMQFMTATEAKLNTIFALDSLLEEIDDEI